MMNRTLLISFLVLAAAIGCLQRSGAGEEADGEVKRLSQVLKRLHPLHRKLAPAEPGDWLAEHQEPGQSFTEYVASDPVLPRGKRRVVYLQPVGEFTTKQRQIVKLTAEYVGLHFGLQVKTLPDLPLSVVPKRARRRHPDWGMKQLLSTWFLDDLLPKKLPPDGAALLAITAMDLWPGKGWNFVFGQASLRNRVGIWSIHRNGDPDKEFKLVLLRTIKTATHELGHMFSMYHCTAYECNMCGSNHREESDRRPLALCPECMAKVAWATKQDPIKRYKNLAAFCKRNGLTEEAAFFKKSLKTLR